LTILLIFFGVYKDKKEIEFKNERRLEYAAQYSKSFPNLNSPSNDSTNENVKKATYTLLFKIAIKVQNISKIHF
jgi:hypothetical protein